MPTYRTPGVYLEEVSSGVRPIGGVQTATTVFFGKSSGEGAPLRSQTFLTSYDQFKQEFCVGLANVCSTLATSVSGFFANGGTRLWVVNLGEEATQIAPEDMALLTSLVEINLIAAPGFCDAASHEAIISHCEQNQGRFAVLDLPDDWDRIEQLTTIPADGGLRPRNADGGVAAVYAPWLKVHDALTSQTVDAPPSGHICGIYARIDAERGVFKAPANTVVRGALNLTHHLSAADQDILNPASVNAIRVFPDGIKVWGARTLSGASSEWRYVPVRRLASFIEESIQKGTQWAVFEPNDQTLWASIERNVDAFLNTYWREGALAGPRPEAAYFVKCNSETMTQSDIEAGIINIQIGIAPLKPAEFIIIRIRLTSNQT